MAEIVYRNARKEDCDAIARLHALNWKKHYRGICPDKYLDEEVEDERLEVWRARFEKEDDKRQIVVVEEDGMLIGFVCTFLDFHPEHGAYLDNLHVLSDYQGHGIGRELMKRAARFVLDNRPGSSLYLHVLKRNSAAIKFYEKLKGKVILQQDVDLPWGGKGPVIDYAWDPVELVGS